MIGATDETSGGVVKKVAVLLLVLTWHPSGGQSVPGATGGMHTSMIAPTLPGVFEFFSDKVRH